MFEVDFDAAKMWARAHLDVVLAAAVVIPAVEHHPVAKRKIFF
jgi:hypothetical protein